MESLDRLPPKKASKTRKWCVLPFARLHPLFGVGEDWGSLSHFVCLRLGSDLIDIHSHLNHYSESMEFIFSNCSLTSSLDRDQIRDGPLENLRGGGRSTKKIIAQGKIKWKKIHARQWILKKYSCYGLKKILTRNLITKNNSCGSKIPLPPPHYFSNGPSLKGVPLPSGNKFFAFAIMFVETFRQPMT